MTPSNTTKGELLAEREDGPRISISLAPDADVPMLELKPATVPFNISNTFVLCCVVYLSALTWETAPVRSFFFTAPYPITTTSSSAC